MTQFARPLAAVTAALSLGIVAAAAHADGRNWNDGPVINVTAVRTVDGHFDDYMQWLSTTFKKQEEAAKKAGVILSYDILVASPRTEKDPDIYIVIRYKNWAALDGIGGKLDAISAQIEGSVDKANQSQAGRAKIRTILGSETMQVADLK
jgi:hypothetical protein